jgi:hypothetical protein
METIQRSYLGWTLSVLAVVGAIFLLAQTKKTLDTATTTNTVSFSGQGSVVTRPDIAVVEVTILTEAPTSQVAQEDNSERSQKVVTFLEGQDIAEEDIRTSSYTINPRYTFPRNGTPVITGYQVRQSLTVKIRDLDQVGAILEGVISAGANEVGGVNLTIDDPEELRQEARAKAIADAKKKARALEDQLDINLGRIIGFSEGGFGGSPVFRAMEADAIGIGGDGATPSIPVGENEIVVQVTLTWQIK